MKYTNSIKQATSGRIMPNTKFIHLIIISVCFYTAVFSDDFVVLNSPEYDRWYNSLLEGKAERGSYLQLMPYIVSKGGSNEEVVGILEHNPLFSGGRLYSNTFYSWNSAYPYGYNDGMLWQGKGSNVIQTAGVILWNDWLSITLLPQLAVSQNIEFESVNSDSEYSHVFSSVIDNPRRYGSETYTSFGFGQSEIRAGYGGWTLGFGTMNKQVGWAYKWPLLLSTNAEGFPSLDFGYFGELYGLGSVEVKILMGRLEESDYFNTNPDDDYRLLNGVFASYSPSFIPGLSLGMNRVLTAYWNTYSPGDFFILFLPSMGGGEDNYFGDDVRDQRFSITWQWFFPQVGAEFYGEWARNDFSPSMEYFIRAPQHSHAINLGLAKRLFSTAEWSLLFRGEICSTVLSEDYEIDLGRGPGATFYGHGKVNQGYTHMGQVIGAGIGTGSNAQYVELFLEMKNLGIKLFFERLDDNLDYLLNGNIIGSISRNPVYSTVGVDATLFGDTYSLTAMLHLGSVINYNYIENNDIVNFRFGLRSSYWF